MRKRGKKMENRRRRQLHQILDLVLDINGMQESCQDRTGNHPTAFLRISGHVAWVNVQIYRDGYKDGIARDVEIVSSFDTHIPYFWGLPMSEMIDVLKREKARRRQPDRAQEN